MPKPKNNKADQETIEALKLQGSKLAGLLFISNIPQEIKEAWAALLPKMSLPQIMELTSVLEAKYIDEKTREVDREYQGKLQAIMDDMRKEHNDKLAEFAGRFNKINGQVA